MNTSKRKTFRAALVLATTLLLANPLQSSAFAPGGGGAEMGGSGMAGGGMADGPQMQGVSGKVVETMNSGGYTYVLVENGSARTWVALPMSAIVVGSDIACLPGMEMSNFKSSSLNRTFESIVFSAGLVTAGNNAAPAGIRAAAAPAEMITVSKAEGPDAYTIGEIFEKKVPLANKPVVVHAKVVKVTREIMGKNWLHLQDGTGSQAAATNDLVVTTDSLPEIGDVVTIKGNLSLDRDFGAGYRYGVIVEGAEVIVGK